MNCNAFREAWKKGSAAEALHDHFDQCSACQLWVDAGLMDDLGGALRPDRFTERQIRQAVRAAAQAPASSRRRWWWNAGFVAAAAAAAWFIVLRMPAPGVKPPVEPDRVTAVTDAEVTAVLEEQFAEEAAGPEALLALVDVHPEYGADTEAAALEETEETEDGGGWYFADVL